MSSCKGLRLPSNADVRALRWASVHFEVAQRCKEALKGPTDGGVWQGLGAPRTTGGAGHCSFVHPRVAVSVE